MRKLACFFALVAMLFCASAVDARNGWQGCCSWHGGIAGYCSNGRMVCNDGTLSPSCLCDDFLDGPESWPVNKVIKRGNWRSVQDGYNLKMTMETSYNGDTSSGLSFSLSTSTGTAPYAYSGYVTINNTKFYICTQVTIPYKYYDESKPSRVLYSIDGGNYIEINIDRLSKSESSDNVYVYFYANDFLEFYYGLRRGNVIRFKLENAGGWSWIEYSLSGFSYVYDRTISYISSVF